MTRDDIKRICDQACVGVAASHDAIWDGHYLEPRLWEALRVELQRRYRRSTGETMAVLSIEDSPVSTPGLLNLAKKLANQVDHCLLGYAISQQNGQSIQDAMLRLRVACNDFQSESARTAWEDEEKLTVEQAWTILCETPDITSPEEYPDHALITMEQLGSYMDRAMPSSQAAADVLAERQRQVSVEDFRTDEDDHYTSGEMAWAATCYLQNAAVAGKMQGLGLLTASECDERGKSLPKPEAWPWDAEWWKPSGQRRDLVKAGALVIAEIERLDRAATQEQKP